MYAGKAHIKNYPTSTKSRLVSHGSMTVKCILSDVNHYHIISYRIIS